VAHEDDQPTTNKVSFALPTQVFGVVEVRRVSRELEALNEYMRQAGLREAGTKQDTLPRVSRLLDATAAENNLNLLVPEDRKALTAELEQVLEKAPTVHMSFASDPSAAFLEKIVSWLRSNIHPFMLIRLGLQPSIAAGCVMRTANRAFDFSLRHRFTEERKLLLYSLEAESPRTPAAAPQPQAVAAPVPAQQPTPQPAPVKVEVTAG
jgi:F0F1-type ATP synthase delta subunit